MGKNPFSVRKLGVMMVFLLFVFSTSFELFVGIDLPRARSNWIFFTDNGLSFITAVCVLTKKLETCLPHQKCIFSSCLWLLSLKTNRVEDETNFTHGSLLLKSLIIKFTVLLIFCFKSTSTYESFCAVKKMAWRSRSKVVFLSFFLHFTHWSRYIC